MVPCPEEAVATATGGPAPPPTLTQGRATFPPDISLPTRYEATMSPTDQMMGRGEQRADLPIAGPSRTAPARCRRPEWLRPPQTMRLRAR